MGRRLRSRKPGSDMKSFSRDFCGGKKDVFKGCERDVLYFTGTGIVAIRTMKQNMIHGQKNAVDKSRMCK